MFKQISGRLKRKLHQTLRQPANLYCSICKVKFDDWHFPLQPLLKGWHWWTIHSMVIFNEPFLGYCRHLMHSISLLFLTVKMHLNSLSFEYGCQIDWLRSKTTSVRTYCRWRATEGMSTYGCFLHISHDNHLQSSDFHVSFWILNIQNGIFDFFSDFFKVFTNCSAHFRNSTAKKKNGKNID